MKRTEVVLGLGVCVLRSNPDAGPMLYRAVQGKLGGVFPGYYRVFWSPLHPSGSLVYGPEEFRGKFERLQEYRYDSPVVEDAPRGPVGPRERLVLGDEVGPGVRQVHREG